MRVELINPDNPTNAANVPFLQKGLLSWKAKAYSPPLNVCMIAAYTPRAYQIADAFRRREVPVVMGAIHASTLPDEALEKRVRRAWLEFYSLKALFHRLDPSMGKIRVFVWLVNLALCFYARKRILRN